MGKISNFQTTWYQITTDCYIQEILFYFTVLLGWYTPVGRFNIMVLSCQYRDSHKKDKTILP